MENTIILSSKSSGSSALQKYFVWNHQYRSVAFTPHHERETLYWSKVASVLGLPQAPMYRSQVPTPKQQAINALHDFLKSNGIMEPGQDDFIDKKDYFKSYYKLICESGFKFVEKSPHHLYNESNLQLLHEFMMEYKDHVRFYIVGLVRHPQAVLYSAWKRWGFVPQQFEKEWYVSYSNLLKWREKLGVVLVRYEDLVTGELNLEEALGITRRQVKFDFKSGSVEKWRLDRRYGHWLSSETIWLAKQFGYEDFEPSGGSLLWNIQVGSMEVKRYIKRILP